MEPAKKVEEATKAVVAGPAKKTLVNTNTVDKRRPSLLGTPRRGVVFEASVPAVSPEPNVDAVADSGRVTASVVTSECTDVVDDTLSSGTTVCDRQVVPDVVEIDDDTDDDIFVVESSEEAEQRILINDSLSSECASLPLPMDVDGGDDDDQTVKELPLAEVIVTKREPEVTEADDESVYYTAPTYNSSLQNSDAADDDRIDPQSHELHVEADDEDANVTLCVQAEEPANVAPCVDLGAAVSANCVDVEEATAASCGSLSSLPVGWPPLRTPSPGRVDGSGSHGGGGGSLFAATDGEVLADLATQWQMTEPEVETVLYAVSGDIDDAESLLLTQRTADGGLPWHQEDTDALLGVSDPSDVERLCDKFGERNVLKRLMFLNGDNMEEFF